MKTDIHVAHSPDSDDAFMFYALASGKVGDDGFNYIHQLTDIETLNQRAFEGQYEVSAISFHAYAYVADKYVLMPCGASMGRNYGPIVVSRSPMTPDELTGGVVAVPGVLTTALLALRLFAPAVRYEPIPFDRILDDVQRGVYEAGLLIHEGQLTYREMGLHKVVDLGEWWIARTGLPLPLGGNVVRRDLGRDAIQRICKDVQASIRYGLEHREEAVQYAMQFARGLDVARADRFIGMYVNDLTLDYGEEGREAVRRLLADAQTAGLIPKKVALEFA